MANAPKGEVTYANCKQCGVRGIISVQEYEDINLMSITERGYCHDCSQANYKAREDLLRPKLAKRIVRSVKPVYKCTICPYETNDKKALLAHITQMHDVWHMEEALGVKHY